MKKTLVTFLFASLCSCVPGYYNWKPVKSESVPGVVAIVSHRDDIIGYSPKCTGTLVKSNAVLTAAHCVDDLPLSNLSVVYGCSDIYDVFGCNKTSLTSVSKHDQFDIALVITEDNLSKKGIKTVPIAVNCFITGQKLALAGYGSNGRLGYTMADVWETSSFSFLTDFTNRKKPEQGNSGGPAYIFKDKKHYLAGITSNYVERYEVKEKTTETFFKGIFHYSVCDQADWINNSYLTSFDKE